MVWLCLRPGHELSMQQLFLAAAAGNIVASDEDIPTRSLEFVAASNQSLELSNADWGTYDRSKFAISLWARRKGDNSSDGLFSKTQSFQWEFNIRFEFWRQIAVETFNETSNGTLLTPAEYDAGAGYEVDNWYHILVTFDASASAGDVLQLWIDGTRITSFATNTQPVGNVSERTSRVRIGRQGDDSYPANAYVYQPALFSGVHPSVSDLRTAEGKPRDIRGLSGLHCLLHTTADSTLEDDEILATNWTNNNAVAKYAGIPA